MNQNQEKKSNSESKILKYCFLASFFTHILIALSSYLHLPSQAKINSSPIVAEFHIPKEIEGKKASSRKKTKKKETLVHKNTLPQLPKKFVIKEKPKKKRKIKHSTKDKEKQKTEALKKMKALELTKQEAMKRLLREKARLKKKNAERDQLALKEKLEKIQLVKAKKNAQKGALSSHGENTNQAYTSKIHGLLQENYEIPDSFGFDSKKYEVALEVTLKKDGNVSSATVVKSSKNATFDKLALNTVWKASPFPLPPRHLVGRKITINFAP